MVLRIVSAGAAQSLVGSAASREGLTIDGTFGAVGAMFDRFMEEAACDVVILTRSQIMGLAADGEALGETATDLGMVATPIAVLSTAPAPDVSSAEGLRAALLASDGIYLPDPVKSTAGIHFAKVLDQLRIRQMVDARLRTFPNGATAMRTMAAAAGKPVGCTQATEILATPGVRLVAPLPRGFELETTYTAAVAKKARAPESARKFVAALAAAGDLRAKAGFTFSS